MAWQTIDGEMVLLHIDARQLIGVNPVAARVWSLCDGAHSVDAIVTAIAGEFAVDAPTAKRDVRAFIAELQGLGAIDL